MELAKRNIGKMAEAQAPAIPFFDHIFLPLLSGALFWEAKNTLLVADLHLEKMSSFARSGQLLPPHDTGATLKRLASDLAETGATRVICLGDSFHRDEGTGTLSADDRNRLAAMIAGRDWLWLAGNHDPAPHALGGICRPHVTVENLVLTHEPVHDMAGQVCGHLHPAARVHINARSVRRPCFVHDERLMMLPAYGVSTGSLNILSPAFTGLFERAALRVTMIGKDRLYPVSAKRLVGG